MQLNKRDFKILKEVYRWRVCLGRHIKELCEFNSQRVCDRRLRALIDNGYLERKKILYGVAGILSLTNQSKRLLNYPTNKEKIKIDQIRHDICVTDTAIYFLKQYNIPLNDFTTERQLHSLDGFTRRIHKPDFVFTKDDKKFCVEIELSLKEKSRMEKNINDNFMTYDTQIWFVDIKSKIALLLTEFKERYPNIKIIDIEELERTKEK